MAANVLVDSGFLVAILTERDSNHRWAKTIADQYPPPWKTCEAVVSETFYLMGQYGAPLLTELLRRSALACPFRLGDNTEEVLALLKKYASVPMSFADACLVRMSETISQPILLTTDTDFRIYRRHSRQVVPCVMPD
jgi:predicted nucleic acid-binding protein